MHLSKKETLNLSTKNFIEMKKVLLINLLIALFGFGYSQDSSQLDSTENSTSQLVITMPFEIIAQNFSKDLPGEIPVTLKLVPGKSMATMPKMEEEKTEMVQTEMNEPTFQPAFQD